MCIVPFCVLTPPPPPPSPASVAAGASVAPPPPPSAVVAAGAWVEPPPPPAGCVGVDEPEHAATSSTAGMTVPMDLAKRISTSLDCSAIGRHRPVQVRRRHRAVAP